MTATETRTQIDTRLSDSIRFWALAAMVLYVVSGIAFAGFSYLGGGWAVASDATAVLLATVLLMLVIALDRLIEAKGGPVIGVAKWLGVPGMAIAIAGGLLLLLGQTVAKGVPLGVGLTLQFIGWVLLGLWFILVAQMALATGTFSRRWAWAARIAGAGQVIAMAFTIPLGPDSVFASIGYAMTFVAVILWSLWTRREVTA